MSTKLKKSDYQTNIDKYRVAAEIKSIKINIHQNHYSKIHELKSRRGGGSTTFAQIMIIDFVIQPKGKVITSVR